MSSRSSTPLITGGILDSISTLKLVVFLEEHFGDHASRRSRRASSTSTRSPRSPTSWMRRSGARPDATRVAPLPSDRDRDRLFGFGRRCVAGIDRRSRLLVSSRNSSRSRVRVPELSTRGTLFCPPSLPRRRIQPSKAPGRATDRAGGGRPDTWNPMRLIIGIRSATARRRAGRGIDAGPMAGSRNSTTYW